MSYEQSPPPWFEREWQQLLDQIAQDRLPHAILFAGLKGLGKRVMAHALSAKLLCGENQPHACGQCKSCQLLKAGTHPDSILILPEDEGKQIKIDQIRSLVEGVNNKPQLGGKKVIVIAPVEDMNINASNALLKTLEEPIDDTVLLLISDAPKRILPTIRSRCQAIRCHKPDQALSLSWLDSQLQSLYAENPELAANAVSTEALLNLAGGRPVEAIEMLSSGRLTLRTELLADFNRLLLGQLDSQKMASQWAKKEVPVVLYWLSHWMEDAVRWFATPQTQVLKNADIAQILEPLPQRASYKGLFELMTEVNLARQALIGGTNPNKQLMLETLLYQMSRWSQGLQVPKPQV